MTDPALVVEIQHWILRFLLKNFADVDGRIFRLDVSDDSVTKPPPKFAAARPNFNLLMHRDEPVSFEARFQKIETAAARAIKDIVATQCLSGLSICQRHAIAVFIAAQSFRTEAYRNGLLATDGRTDLASAWHRIWESLPHLTAMIERQSWSVMETIPTIPFYLGDNPVVLQSTEQPGDAMEIGLDVPGIEVFFPLSPTLALYLPCPAISRAIIDGFHTALTMSSWLLERSALQSRGERDAIELAEKAITSSGSLYRSLTQGIAFAADPENVENLNYLQCAWASSALYSSRSDFSFAKRVFRENPDYRKVMPVRLVTLWK